MATVTSLGLIKPEIADQVSDTIPALSGNFQIIDDIIIAHLVNLAYHGSVLRQAIINGNFAINQRVVTGTVTLSAGAYGHDRWKAGATGCTYTFATSGNVTTITITAGSLQQIIEGSNLFTGTYVLSWVGTSQGKISAGAYGASGITGSATGGTNLTVEFGIGTLSKAQFNFGTAVLPFSPKSFAEELALCRRYYRKFEGIIKAIAGSTTDLNFNVGYPVDMRILPTLISSGVVANTVLTPQVAWYTPTSIAVVYDSVGDYYLINCVGTWIVGQYYELMPKSITAWDAEF